MSAKGAAILTFTILASAATLGIYVVKTNTVFNPKKYVENATVTQISHQAEIQQYIKDQSDMSQGRGSGTGADDFRSDKKLQEKVNTETPQDTGMTAKDDELIKMFMEAGAEEAKAYGLLACYKACTDCGMSTFQSLGLLGCAMCEGQPGLVQYGFELQGFGKSSANAKLYIDTAEKANAWEAKIIKSRGCGTAQWTDTEYKGKWSYRGKNYVNLIKKYVKSTPTDYKTVWQADYEMYKSDLNGTYHILVAELPKHSSTLESTLIYSYFRYEAGYGNYKNSDSLASYSGTHEKNIKNRLTAATTLETVFKKHNLLK